MEYSEINDINLIEGLDGKNIQPDIRPFYNFSKKKNYYRAQETHPILFTYKKQQYAVVFEKGNEYDGASVPWVAKPLIRLGADGSHRNGTYSHDMWYMLEKTNKNTIIVGQERNACVERLYAFVDNKWVRATLELTKREVDDLMMQIIDTTEEAHIYKWQAKLVSWSFRTPIGHKYWRRYSELNQINPLRCSI